MQGPDHSGKHYMQTIKNKMIILHAEDEKKTKKKKKGFRSTTTTAINGMMFKIKRHIP